ncbi:MAG: hypothetical protein R3296_02765 [Oleiphilaceae bacterium]|nr:hypothetical protein [Oleiphilaceae bacterium]
MLRCRFIPLLICLQIGLLAAPAMATSWRWMTPDRDHEGVRENGDRLPTWRIGREPVVLAWDANSALLLLGDPDLQLWQSRGDGLWAPATPRPLRERVGFLGADSSARQLRLASSDEQPRRLQVLQMQAREPALLAPFDQTLAWPGESVRLRDDRGNLRRWGRSRADDNTMTVRGPARLQMEYRLLLTAPQQTLPAITRVAWQLDREAAGEQLLDRNRLRVRQLEVEGCSRLVSEPLTAELVIPGGEHRLRLDFPVEALVRLKTLAPDLLMPGINHRVDDALSRYAEQQSVPQAGEWRQRLLDALPEPDTQAFWQSSEGFWRPLAARRPAPAPTRQRRTGVRLAAMADGQVPSLAGSDALAHPRPFPQYDLSELPPGGSLILDLPPRRQGSELQLVLAGLPESEQNLEVRYDNDQRWPLQWRPQQRQVQPLHRDRRARALAGLPLAQGAGTYMEGAAAVLPLPAGVRRVHITSPNGSEPVWLAADYRAQRPPLLNETLINPALAAMGPDRALQWLRKGDTPEVSLTDAHPPLDEALLQLRQLLQQRAEPLRATLAPPSGPLPGNLWQRLARLEAADEQRQAEQLLTGIAIHGDTPAQRARALAGLQERQLPQDNPLRWQSLLAAVWQVQGDARVLPLLSTSLIRSGDYPLAWLLLQMQLPQTTGLQTPIPEPLAESLALASLMTENPDSLSQALNALPPQRQAYWRGHQALHQQDPEQAAGEWALAGPEGQSMLAHLAQGQAISDELQSGGFSRSTLDDWARWLQAQTGEDALWHSLEDSPGVSAGPVLAMGYQGSPSVRLQQATPEQPVTLHLSGPARVQVTLRPLHAPGEEDRPLDDWVTVTVNGESWQIPVLGNTAPGTLTRLDGQGRYGTAETVELTLGTGISELSLSPQQQTHGISVAVARSPLTLPLLPELNASQRLAFSQIAPVTLDWQRPRDCGAVNTRGAFFPLPVTALSPQTRDQGLAGAPATAIQASHRQPQQPPSVPPSDPLSPLTALLWQMAHADNALRREGYRARLLAAVADFEASTEQQERYLQALRSRAQRDRIWQEVDAVAGGAGVQVRTLPGGRSTSTQVRTTLSEDTLTESAILLDTDSTGIAFELQKTTPVRALVRVTPQLFAPEATVPFILTLDQQPPQNHRIAPGSRRHIVQWRLQAGEHNLRARLPKAWSDRLVSVEWQWQRNGLWEPLAPERRATVLVSERVNPVTLYLEQDTWLRVDDWLEDRIESHTLLASGPGWWRLPHANSKRRQVRIYQLVEDPKPTDKAEARLPPTPLPDPEDVAPPDSALPGLMAQPVSALPDHQPGGTWSAGAGYRFERAGPGDDRGNDQGPELLLQYRLHPAPLPLYLRTDAHLRAHNGARASYGVRQWLDLDWPGSAWALSFKGALFQQQRVETDSPLTSWQLSARIDHQIRVSNRGYWRAFGRLYAWDLDDEPAGIRRFRGLDGDIWTPWKASHRNGLQLGSSYLYRPYRDSEGIAGISLWSREDIAGLDSVEPALEWRQFLHGTTASARFSVRHYLSGNPRQPSVTLPRLGLGLDGRTSFGRPGSLAWHAGADLGLKRGNAGLHLQLIWHWDGRRGLQDVRPREWAFRRLHDIELLEETRKNDVVLP